MRFRARELHHLDRMAVNASTVMTRESLVDQLVENDWVKNGFTARAQTDEVKLRGLTVQQLVNTKDITAAVNARPLTVP